jgi:hypothetical protein
MVRRAGRVTSGGGGVRYGREGIGVRNGDASGVGMRPVIYREHVDLFGLGCQVRNGDRLQHAAHAVTLPLVEVRG